MQRVKLVKGQDAWVYMSGQSGNPSKGKCIEVLNLDGYDFEHYVIEIPTSVDPVLQIRDGATVTDDPAKPIGFWRRSHDIAKLVR